MIVNTNTESQIEHATEDERIVQLVGSSIGDDVAGDMPVFLTPQEEIWTPEHGLRLTGDDVLELISVLEEAVETVSGSDPQAFIRLVIVPSGYFGEPDGWFQAATTGPAS